MTNFTITWTKADSEYKPGRSMANGPTYKESQSIMYESISDAIDYVWHRLIVRPDGGGSVHLGLSATIEGAGRVVHLDWRDAARLYTECVERGRLAEAAILNDPE